MGKAHQDSGKSAQTQAAMIAVLGEKAFKAAGAISKIKELGPINLITKEQIDAVGKMADRIDEMKRLEDWLMNQTPEYQFDGLIYLL